MNIQEGIKELESHKMKSEDIRAIRYNDGINAGIAVMKNLGEPQPAQQPVVPKAIAALIEKYKEDGVQLIDILVCFKAWSESEEGDYRDEISWVVANPETFMRAWLIGYEVKKEPLYRVKLGEGYFVEYHGRGALIMIIPDDNKEIKIFDSKSDAERTAQVIGGTVEEVVEG